MFVLKSPGEEVTHFLTMHVLKYKNKLLDQTFLDPPQDRLLKHLTTHIHQEIIKAPVKGASAVFLFTAESRPCVFCV